jgi:hypothetical protein
MSDDVKFDVYNATKDRSVLDAIDGAMEMSHLRHATIGFEFNGVSLVVKEESKKNDVIAAYNDRMSRINQRNRQPVKTF